MGFWDWISNVSNDIREGLSNIGNEISNAIDSAIDWVEEHTGWDLPEPNEERGYEPPKNQSSRPSPPSNLSSQGGTSTAPPSIPNLPSPSEIFGSSGGARRGASGGGSRDVGSGGGGGRSSSGGESGGRGRRSRPRIGVPEIPSGTLISPELAKAKMNPKQILLEQLKGEGYSENVITEALSNLKLENVEDVRLAKQTINNLFSKNLKDISKTESQIKDYINKIKNAPSNAVIILGGRKVSKEEALKYYQNKLKEIQTAKENLRAQYKGYVQSLNKIETQLRLEGKVHSKEYYEKELGKIFKDPLKGFFTSLATWTLSPLPETAKLFGYMLTGKKKKAKEQFVEMYKGISERVERAKRGEKVGKAKYIGESIVGSTLGEVAMSMGVGYGVGALGSTIGSISSTAGTLFNVGLGAVAVPQIVKDVLEIKGAKEKGMGEFVGKIIEKGVSYTAFGIGASSGMKEFTPKVTVEEKPLGLNVTGIKGKESIVVEYKQPEIVGIKIEHPLGKAKGIYSIEKIARGELLPTERGMFGLFEVKSRILGAKRQGNIITGRMLKNVESKVFRNFERIGVKVTPVKEDITQVTLFKEKKGRFEPFHTFFTKEKETWRIEGFSLETPEFTLKATRRGGIFTTSEEEIIPFKESLLEYKRAERYGFRIEKPRGRGGKSLVEDLISYGSEIMKQTERVMTKIEGMPKISFGLGVKEVSFELPKITPIILPKMKTKTKERFEFNIPFKLPKLSLQIIFPRIKTKTRTKIFQIPKMNIRTLEKIGISTKIEASQVQGYKVSSDITQLTKTKAMAPSGISPPKIKISIPKFPVIPKIWGGSGKELKGWGRKLRDWMKKLFGYQNLPDIIGAMKEKKKIGKVRRLPFKLALKYLSPISIPSLVEIKKKRKKRRGRKR